MTTISPVDKELPGNLKPLIGIVGPCGAGKTTLAEGLRRNGYRAHAIVQEHSYVKDMWQRITKPAFLIFLQASWSVGAERRRMKWTMSEWEEQQRRLSHAFDHANFRLDTDPLGIIEVLDLVLEYLQNRAPL
jgi:ABC-type glutathione transport system ATPase component